MSLTLKEFLKARINEREATTKLKLSSAISSMERCRANTNMGGYWASHDIKDQMELDLRAIETEKLLLDLHDEDTWWDWRVSEDGRDVETPYCRSCVAGVDCTHCVGSEDFDEYRHCRIHLILVQPYSSHPQFNSDWVYPKIETPSEGLK